MTTSDFGKLEAPDSYARRLFIAAALSGSTLILLLPVGFYGLNTFLFSAVWWIHLVLHFYALCMAFSFFASLVSSKGTRGWSYFVVFCMLAFFAVLPCLVPITARDALIYHLEVPRQWLASGKVHEIPWNEWSYSPLLLSLGYAGLLRNGFIALAPAYHFSYLLLLAAASSAFLFRRTRHEEPSLFAFVFCLSIPLLGRLATEPMADLAVSFFFISAFEMLVSWSEAGKRPRELFLCGLFLGLCLSAKYNALLVVSVFLPLAALYLVSVSCSLREALKAVVFVGLIALLCYLPWPIKNIVWTGNPVFPFLGELFGTGKGTPFLGDINPLVYRMQAYGESWFELAAIPLRMLFTGEDGNPRLFDGVLSPLFLLAVVPVVVLLRPRLPEKERWVVLGTVLIAVYFLCSVFLFHAYVRYQVPLFGILIALCAYGVFLIAERSPSKVKYWIFLLVLAAQAGLFIRYTFSRNSKLHVQEYLSGSLTHNEYLEQQISECKVAHYVNSLLPATSRVLLLFTGNRFMLYEREVRGRYFSAQPIIEVLKGANGDTAEKRAEELSVALKRDGITHLAMHNRRIVTVLESKLDPQEIDAWNLFLSGRVVLLARRGQYSIWMLKD